MKKLWEHHLDLGLFNGLTYFGAILYKNTETIKKIKLGIQAAIKGGKPPFTENCSVIRIKKIYIKLINSPIPIFMPVPPLLFLEAKETPISVNIKVENGKAVL